MYMMSQEQMREGRWIEAVVNSYNKRKGLKNKVSPFLYQCGCGCGISNHTFKREPNSRAFIVQQLLLRGWTCNKDKWYHREKRLYKMTMIDAAKRESLMEI